MITINESGFDVNGPLSAFTASGGTAPYTFSVVAGVMPGGLKLASNGTVSGTTTGGTYDVTIRATDTSSGPQYGDRQYVGTLRGAHIVPIIMP